MGMTLAEKLISIKVKKKKVSSGEVIFVPLDLIMGTEISSPLSIKIFEEMSCKKIFDKNKLVFINDHFVPAKDIAAANLAKITKNFAKKYDINHYYEVGRCGICHVTVPEMGLVVPGDIVVGADSHTCTYGALGAFATGVGSTDLAVAWALGELWFKVPASIKIIVEGALNKYVSGKDIILHVIGHLGVAGASYKALEFCGSTIDNLSMADRFTICNMAIECGAKTALIEADEVTRKFLEGKTLREWDAIRADENAEYINTIKVYADQIDPLVAFPYLPSNIKSVKEINNTILIDQVVIGSCTNGRIEDFRIAYHILKEKKVHDNVKLIIIPGSPLVLKEMIKENILSTFIDAGAVIAPSTCGPCIGGHMGVLAENEVGLYTTNRNFKGRNGAITSKVYLSNPAVAAYSAIVGKIALPD